MTLNVTLYSADGAIRSAIRNAFEGENYHVVEITDSSKFSRPGINEQQQEGAVGRLRLPDTVDLVVTRSALNSRTEGLAATLGLKQKRNDVYAVVIPEAMDFIRDRLTKRGSLVLVGADQAK